MKTMTEKLLVSDFRCDYPRCPCISFVEVFKTDRWFYLCFFHFVLLKPWKWAGWSLADWMYRLPLISRLWNWWAKMSERKPEVYCLQKIEGEG